MPDTNKNPSIKDKQSVVVPVHCDAVLMTDVKVVCGPLNDFTQLPWAKGNKNDPYIGKTVNSPNVFQPNHVLQPGLHMHWSLPKVLTKSASIPIVEKTQFLSVFGQDKGGNIWKLLQTAPNQSGSPWIAKLEGSESSAVALAEEKRVTYSSSSDPDSLISHNLSGIKDLFNQSNFPPVPNRWIVTKKNKGAQVETKVVESDYMWPESTENDPDGKNLSKYNSIFPVNTNSADEQPYRYVGRVVNPGNQADSKDNYLPHALTAVGFGDPSFAAFYPLSRSVFGYYDQGVASADADTTYEITGYYSNLNQDYFRLFKSAYLTQWAIAHDSVSGEDDTGNNKETKQKNYKYIDLLEAIRAEFEWFIPISITTKQGWPDLENLGWVDDKGLLQPKAYHYKSFLPTDIDEKVRDDVMKTINLAIKEQLPDRMICSSCYAMVQANDPPKEIPEVDLVIGHSPTEALSASIASKLSLPQKKIIEEHLEAIQFSADLEHLNLDIGPTFETLSHKKQFSDEYGGLVWTIRSKSTSNTKADKSVNEHQPALPYELGAMLNDLNLFQKSLDDTLFKIESTREQIYADWCRFLEFEKKSQGDSLVSGKFIKSETKALQTLLDSEQNFLAEINNNQTAITVALAEFDTSNQILTDMDISDWSQFWVEIENYKPAQNALNNAIKNRDKSELLAQLNAWINSEDSPPKLDFKVPTNLSKEGIELQQKLKSSNSNAGDQIWLNRLIIEALFSQVKHKGIHILEPKPASRFWRPNDPTILINGFELSSKFDLVNSSRQDGLEVCYPLSDFPDLKEVNSGMVNKLIQAISELSIVPKAPENAGDWHPLFMNWTVGFNKAIMYDDNNVITIKKYFPGYITDSYSLQNPDFQLNPDKIKDPKSATVDSIPCSGRTTLTPHAGNKLLNVVAARLAPFISEEISLPDVDFGKWPDGSKFLKSLQGTANGDSLNTELQNYLINNSKDGGPGVVNWYIDRIQQGEVFKKFNKQGNYTLEANLSEFVDWTLAATDNKSNKINVLHAAIYICSYQKLITTSYLSQTLSGFNEILQSRNQLFQLPVAHPDPLDESIGLTVEDVRLAVQGGNRFSPGEEVLPFSPIRAGSLGIEKIELVDSFGRSQSGNIKFSYSELTLPESLSNSEDPAAAYINPRFAQPTRLNFRWLDATKDCFEANTHPATNPICGWLLPNNLDDSIYIYDKEGWALGYIDQGCAWRTFPGNSVPVLPEDIENKHLSKVASWICKQGPLVNNGSSLMTALISTLDTAMENIEPENFAQHEALSLLMGQPLAVVRTLLELEIKGLYSININTGPFKDDLINFNKDQKLHKRPTLNYESVKVPVIVGDDKRLHDGLVGYWVEEAESYRDNSFFTPYEKEEVETSLIKKPQANDLQLSIDATAPLFLTMLVDPKAKVHAHCGVLPKKGISLPPDFYSNALKNIQVTFLTAPILSLEGAIHLSLPNEPGFEWSWLETDGNKWTEISTTGILRKHQVETLFKAQVNNIWNLLTQLGWIKPIDERKAVVVPTDQRLTPDLDASLASMQDQLELMLSKTMINPFSPEAHFVPNQEIKEGWLKISKNKS